MVEKWDLVREIVFFRTFCMYGTGVVVIREWFKKTSSRAKRRHIVSGSLELCKNMERKIFIHMHRDPNLVNAVIECLVALEASWTRYLRHRMDVGRCVTEDSFEDVRIRDGMARIDDLKREIERQRRTLAAIRSRIKRKKELERVRKSRESDRKSGK